MGSDAIAESDVMIIRTIPAGDLLIQNGTAPLTQGPIFVRQKIAARFQFFKGEWFLDLRQGIPYFQNVLGKNPNLAVIQALFRKVVATTPGVAYVPDFALLFDHSSRHCTFRFIAKLIGGGAVVVSPTDEDFLVDISP
jgi:hypothetical protein